MELQAEFDYTLRKLNHLVSKVKNHNEFEFEVAIFRDGPYYTIIIGGNGQMNFGDMSKACFQKLRDEGYLEEDSYGGGKNRSYYKFLKKS